MSLAIAFVLLTIGLVFTAIGGLIERRIPNACLLLAFFFDFLAIPSKSYVQILTYGLFVACVLKYLLLTLFRRKQ